MTDPENKLLAISSLVRVHAKGGSSTDTIYYVGTWKQSMSMDLLWNSAYEKLADHVQYTTKHLSGLGHRQTRG